MYGMVNQAVRGLVIENFGEDVWHKIHTTAQAPEGFVSLQLYDDTVTFKLVEASVAVLDMPAEGILQAFGNYWVDHVATAHYSDLMNKTGLGFLDFIKNLDHMHQRIQTTFPNYEPPSFRVVDLGPNTVQMDYYSIRQGLLPFVEGLLEGLARHFKAAITITHVPDDAHPMPCKRMRIEHRPLTP